MYEWTVVRDEHSISLYSFNIFSINAKAFVVDEPAEIILSSLLMSDSLIPGIMILSNSLYYITYNYSENIINSKF